MTIKECNEISTKFFAIPAPSEYSHEISQRSIFLAKTFTGHPTEFCEFLGHMMSELKHNKKIKRDEIISIMSDIAHTALNVGRYDGRFDAIKHYGRDCFQFLIEDRRETA